MAGKIAAGSKSLTELTLINLSRFAHQDDIYRLYQTLFHNPSILWRHIPHRANRALFTTFESDLTVTAMALIGISGNIDEAAIRAQHFQHKFRRDKKHFPGLRRLAISPFLKKRSSPNFEVANKANKIYPKHFFASTEQDAKSEGLTNAPQGVENLKG